MSGRTVEEAELEIQLAGVFGREPAAWATKLVRESSGTPDSAGLLTEAGFCEEDARRGALLMESGHYADLEDVARSMLWDPMTRGRNVTATSERVAEAVKRVESRQVAEPEGATFVDGKRVR